MVSSDADGVGEEPVAAIGFSDVDPSHQRAVEGLNAKRRLIAFLAFGRLLRPLPR